MDRGISPEPSLDSEEFSRLCRLWHQDGMWHSRGSGDTGTAAPGSDGSFVGMLRVCGSAGSSGEEAEDEEEEEQEDEQEEDEEEQEDNEEEEEEEDDEALVSVYAVQSAASAALLEQFPALWARSPLDCGRLAREERLDGPPVPFQRQPRLPAPVERRMAELLREYLREGIVEEGSSGCSSPLILLEKPHGRGWRLSLDCGALNAATAAGPPARPDRAAILASVPPRSRFFSVLDLCSACLAVPLARSSRPRFAFTFQGRQFWFARLPPTFRGTASILHRRVAAALAPLEPGVAAGVRHYYDDILVTGKSWRQAESRTWRVLQLLQSSGFKVNAGKAQLLQRRVLYLGVTLSAAGRGVPDEKVLEMRRECDAPGPWDRRRLLSVLKKFEARQEFIPDFWELALPLQRLAEPGREWEWRREQREQLRRLRDALEAAPVLPFPVRSRPFVLRLSVHAETAGARLLQESAGALVPVGHSSHRLRGRGLPSPDAWLRAAVRAVRAFRTLAGPAPLVIPDPQGNFLLRAELPAGSQLPEPWTLLVVLRAPEPPQCAGISVPPAPPLSRLPADVPRSSVWFLAVERGLWPHSSFGFRAASLEGQGMNGVCGKGSREDAELEALRELLVQHRSRFPLFLYTGCPGLAARLQQRERDGEQGGDPGWDAGPEVLQWLRAFPGMLRIREVGAAAEPQERERLQEAAQSAAALGSATRSCWIRWEPAVPERREIVAQCHQRRHEGAGRTLRRAWAVETWDGARREVTRWVRRCPTCRESGPDDPDDPDSSDGDRDDDPDAPQREEGLWSRLRLSLSGALPRSPEGFAALLLVQDALSGWLDAVPLRERSRPEVRRALLRDVFGRLGSVRSVLLPPRPAWLRRALQEPPLRRRWGRLELSEPPPAAAGVCGAAQAAGPGWAEALPLILAAARSRWVDPAELRPLLCVPGLPLELRREWPVRGGPGGNELLRLRGARRLPGYRDQVEAAVRGELRAGPRPVRDWGTPDPGSRFARDQVRRRWIREWLEPDLERDGIGASREPEPPREAEGLWLDWSIRVTIMPSSGSGAA